MKLRNYFVFLSQSYFKYGSHIENLFHEETCPIIQLERRPRAPRCLFGKKTFLYAEKGPLTIMTQLCFVYFTGGAFDMTDYGSDPETETATAPNDSDTEYSDSENDYSSWGAAPPGTQLSTSSSKQREQSDRQYSDTRTDCPDLETTSNGADLITSSVGGVPKNPRKRRDTSHASSSVDRKKTPKKPRGVKHASASVRRKKMLAKPRKPRGSKLGSASVLREKKTKVRRSQELVHLFSCIAWHEGLLLCMRLVGC